MPVALGVGIQKCGARRVGADQITLDQVSGRAGARDLHAAAIVVVARDDIPRPQSGPTDDVSRAAADEYADRLGTEGRIFEGLSRGAGADVIALDQVARRGGTLDANTLV